MNQQTQTSACLKGFWDTLKVLWLWELPSPEFQIALSEPTATVTGLAAKTRDDQPAVFVLSWDKTSSHGVPRNKSSTEAEYRSLSETASEMAWMCQILRELGVPLHLTPQLFCDNLSAVMLTANPAFHSKTKHFELDHHYVRERVAIGALVVKHIPGYLQLADIFTKSLPEAPFTALRRKLGVDVPSTPSLRGAVKPNDTAPLNEHTLGLSKSKPTTNTCQTQTLQRSPAVELHDKGRATMKELCTKSKSSPVPIHNRYSSLQLSD